MSSYEERFEAGLAHLHRYVAAHGSSSPPHGSTIDGFLIGSWVGSRRTEYRRGRLSAERIRRIETEFPDWRWNVREAMFDVGLAHLRRYVAAHGTSTVSQHEVFDGFALGQWVTNRRADYRKGRLSAERIEVFERELADDDPGFCLLDALRQAGGTVELLLERKGFTQSWRGAIEKVSSGMGFANVMTESFHLHLRGGSVAGWRWQADAARLVALDTQDRPIGLFVRGADATLAALAERGRAL